MPGVRCMRMVRGIVASMLLLCLPLGTRSEEAAPVDELPAAPKIIFSEVVDGGMFFLNGEYIEAPYRVETDGETLLINGQVCSVDLSSSRGEFGEFDGEDFRDRGMRGRFGDRRHFGHRTRPDSQEWGADSPSRGRSQTRGFNSHRRTARQVVQILSNDQAVLLFEETRELLTVFNQSMQTFCEVLLDEKPVAEMELAQSLTRRQIMPESQELWENWLRDYTPPESAQVAVRNCYEQYMQIKENNMREIAAVHRLDRYSYPLTLVGMAIGVFALGHLLRWPDKRDQAESGGETVRAVQIALGLMMAMAVIDLAWTILASQAGVMKEVNPLAEKLVKTPLQLAIFKTFATAVGFGIFYVWRQRRQIQVATWWMCLVCVLVTFRWIIFDSAVSP